MGREQNFQFQRGPWTYGAPWGGWAPAWTGGWARGNFGPETHEHGHGHIHGSGPARDPGGHGPYPYYEQGSQGWQKGPGGFRGGMMRGMNRGDIQALRSDLADLKRRIKRVEKKVQ